ncbi:recombinase family protein [Streptomyces canus]|uniref:recombinase family protein n=1 Tax=Streptomyces canus TaxID=58343 RepID=UPI003814A17F
MSNDRHRRDGHGVQDQAKHCARIATQHRMIVVHRYVDNDKSASKLGVKRPEFDAMLDALKLGTTTAGFPIDGVVCVSDDRLYRDVHTYQQFLKCFTEHPSRVYADGVLIRPLQRGSGTAWPSRGSHSARREQEASAPGDTQSSRPG